MGDISSLNDSISNIVNVKYGPSGNKLILTSSSSVNIYQCVASAVGTSVENVRLLTLKSQLGTVTKNPNCLGENYVLFDTEFENYLVVYDIENTRYTGDISLIGESSFFTNNFSIPHPFHCLIASANQNVISLITPTSYNLN